MPGSDGVSDILEQCAVAMRKQLILKSLEMPSTFSTFFTFFCFGAMDIHGPMRFLKCNFNPFLLAIRCYICCHGNMVSLYDLFMLPFLLFSSRTFVFSFLFLCIIFLGLPDWST